MQRQISRANETSYWILVFLIANLLIDGLSCRLKANEIHLQPYFNQYCVRCHGSEEANGEINLDHFMSTSTDNLETLQAAMEAVEERRMPPEDEAQLNDKDRDTFLSLLKAQLSQVTERPGHFRIRKLSAQEYRNTMRSLFGFELEEAFIKTHESLSEKSLILKLMPPDPPGASGFTNDTRGHRMTSVAWDRYVYIADLAVYQLLKSPKRREQLETFTGPIGDDGMTPHQAQQLLREFLVRAWRRDIPEDVVTDFLSSTQGKTGDDLIDAVATEMQTILNSPQFLYRGVLVEPVPGKIVPVDPFELAERLSYFLWADMPDEELLEVARSQELLKEDVYQKQIDRMLDSPKARSLTEDFAKQWLKIGEIYKSDKRPYIANALQDQPYDFINSLISDDRPLMELIDSETTFVNFHLRNYYAKDMDQLEKYRSAEGIEKETLPLQKIRLENTPGRGGLLTMPGVLAMNRGPIMRGVWMLERIVGDHLGEPPPNVEPVKQKLGDKRSFREKFAEHRSNSTCAVCHNRIDALGFALQAYDEEGAYFLADDYETQQRRRRPANASSLLPSPEELDSSGRLPSGEQFRSFDELKNILTGSYRERIVRNIVCQMTSYALCRPVELHDQPTIDRLTSNLSDPNATWRDLIHGVATSLPFKQACFPLEPGDTTNVHSD
ncbi:DUF1592 domain-containing protein [Bremerella sp. P1]|uniref:DUF1592 domain-containing protein n=1 Tax=Bremerella sp. P1 TaxID=3026424 RepID=UPI00236820C6|nr:DUF1592 domain-containing protein [Bremerella sp. P1]WDI43757.1 DUF1592 domain-containing protein [Bremerella sp. P1]